MDDTPLGRSYAADFIAFLKSQTALPDKHVLEIGAGRGYLLYLLRESGAYVLGVEPGANNASHWQQRGVPVVNDIFPSAQISQSFDLVVGFALLEHVDNLDDFLESVADRLVPDGLAVFAVPDCTRYIADGDPGMLVHEHWSYFTADTLAAVMTKAGFEVRAVTTSNYGGLLYVAATPAVGVTSRPPSEQTLMAARRFGSKSAALRAAIAKRVQLLAEARRSLGIYVPGRALMWIDPATPARFFDDDPDIHGQYYPPFAARIENREDLFNSPVDELWIMSRSFGEKIARGLRDHACMSATSILMIDDLLPQSVGG